MTVRSHTRKPYVDIRAESGERERDMCVCAVRTRDQIKPLIDATTVIIST